MVMRWEKGESVYRYCDLLMRIYLVSAGAVTDRFFYGNKPV